jgi:hypothetical protein
LVVEAVRNVVEQARQIPPVEQAKP